MAATYGRLYGGNENGDTKAATRSGSRYVTSRLETWNASVTTTLFKDGKVRVEVGEKDGSGATTVYTGEIEV